jgi:hypothetical protein
MADKNNNHILQQALEYHQLGWCIIPIQHLQKEPIRSWKKYQEVCSDEKELFKWFATDENNLAVVLGKVSGDLCCRDFDSVDEYELWKYAHPDLAARLPTVKTARGFHVYFTHGLESIKHVRNGELRGYGGYCLLPPSIHPSGSAYQWDIPPTDSIPLLDPFENGLAAFTEETEETEEIEETEVINMHIFDYSHLDTTTKTAVDHAIGATLPAKDGERNRHIFEFARWLKSIPLFANCRAGQIKSLVKEWHRQALPVIGTKPFDETWRDLAAGWDKVRHPKGNHILKHAAEMAMNSESLVPGESLFDSREAKLLARVCFFLQELQGTEPFWISYRDAGGLLGVSHTDAGKWLKMLIEDNIISVQTPYTKRTAPRLRYIYQNKQFSLDTPHKKGQSQPQSATQKDKLEKS